jgi:hypothetical protein
MDDGVLPTNLPSIGHRSQISFANEAAKEKRGPPSFVSLMEGSGRPYLQVAF